MALKLKYQPEPHIVSYGLYRSTIGGSSYGLAASAIDGANYDDRTVQSGAIYYYVVGRQSILVTRGFD